MVILSDAAAPVQLHDDTRLRKLIHFSSHCHFFARQSNMQKNYFINEGLINAG